MRLIIGGAFQGKLGVALEKERAARKAAVDDTFADGLIADGAVCTVADCRSARIVNRFHLLVKRALQGEADMLPELEAFVHDEQQAVRELTIICDELGCGVVPFEKEDREWREKTGRLLCELAQRAEEVYRVIAGVAVRIK
jgi:adenosylcobinamide kinase/adenosylcobinamide-phosphate guanylyltransferase